MDIIFVNDNVSLGENVRIGDRNEFRGEAKIGDAAQLGNDVVIGDGTIIEFGACISSNVVLPRGSRVREYFVVDSIDGTLLVTPPMAGQAYRFINGQCTEVKESVFMHHQRNFIFLMNFHLFLLHRSIVKEQVFMSQKTNNERYRRALQSCKKSVKGQKFGAPVMCGVNVKIGPKASIGDEVVIGNMNEINGGVIIGRGSETGDWVRIKSGARIGKNVCIDSRVIIGANAKIKDNALVVKSRNEQGYVEYFGFEGDAFVNVGGHCVQLDV